MQQYDVILAPLIFIACASIGAVIFVNAHRNSSANATALISVAVGSWIMSAYLSDLPQLIDYSLFLNRLVFVFSIFLSVGLCYLTMVYPKVNPRAHLVFWILAVYLVIITYIILATPKIISSIQVESWGTNLIFGNLISVYYLTAASIILYGSVRMIIIYYKANVIDRKKILPLAYGLIITLLINVIVHFFIREFVGSDKYYRFGNYSTAIFVIYIAYAIIRYQLFNIKLIATQAALVLVIILLFVQIFASTNTISLFTNILTLIGVTFGGYLLLKSIIKEHERDELIRKANRQLKREKEALAEIDAMKTEFISIASHELLTPIATIKGFLSMTLNPKLVKLSDPKAKEYVANAFEASSRVNNLVNDLLNVSRIEQNRLPITKRVIDINKLIQTIIDEFQFRLKETNARLVFRPSATIKLPEVYADEAKIKEVVVNLVSNAIKYSPPKPDIVINTHSMSKSEIEQRSEPKPGLHRDGALVNTINAGGSNVIGDYQLAVSVKDNGLGLTQAEKGKLFQKFSRIINDDRANITGTGLGLYISKALAEMQYGRLWVESAGRHRGSTFYLTLPYAKHHTEIIGSDKVQEAKSKEQ